MTLKEKYALKDKKRTKQFIFLYSILAISFMMYFSLAKFERISEGQVKIAVANWKIKLNGKELTSDDNKLEDSITLIPVGSAGTEAGIEIEEIEPGQSGYFDIEIDPTDTEVSFSYQVILDLENSKLPERLTISSYSLDGGVTKTSLPGDMTVSNTVSLGEKPIFTESDVQKIRYYWEWVEGDENTGAYTIIANVEVMQVL